ncbi:MAG TPA: flavodoxin domain-containing protein, partial [Nitrospirota bacterium]|nr:flavodoxin domain-containing protein [Nitrospirota bacterium]
MTKCLVVFFSQGGTTRRIAESIAKGIRSGDIDVNLFNIKDGQLPDLKKYDVLGIGSPTYYFRPPFIVSDCLDNLPDLSGKKVFTFILHGTYPGDAGNRVRRALKNKGGSEIGYSRYYGADYFLGYVKQGYLFSPDQPKPEKIGEAEQFGRELAARVAGKPYTQQDYDPAPAVIYRLQRVLLSRFLIRHQYSRLFGADKKACSACGLCMKLCPT